MQIRQPELEMKIMKYKGKYEMLVKLITLADKQDF
jgi:hypothetical protein